MGQVLVFTKSRVFAGTGGVIYPPRDPAKQMAWTRRGEARKWGQLSLWSRDFDHAASRLKSLKETAFQFAPNVQSSQVKPKEKWVKLSPGRSIRGSCSLGATRSLQLLELRLLTLFISLICQVLPASSSLPPEFSASIPPCRPHQLDQHTLHSIF